ncbi:MAG: recombination mediator RecR [Chloroflexota bacterium]|nr:recombination mediator RecR [Chloroflexota bacterium]
MAAVPKVVSRLIEAFGRLPGIGPKTASRLTYYLLRAGKEDALALAEALTALHHETVLCSICYNISEEDPCPICADMTRDRDVICVVEEPLDVLAIEKTGRFNGLYHVLHGHISPMERIGPEDLRIKELEERLQDSSIREVIVATNPDMEGDATAVYLSRLVAPKGIKVTRLALGLPRGGDLEYADQTTLGEALAGRREM